MSLSQQAYEAIKHRIVTLDLAPGSVIDEAMLRDELKVGRTPIREALQRLKRDKLVTILPRRGMFVSDINMSELPMLYESRIVLESYIARLAATRGTPAHWDEMATVLDTVTEGAQFSTLDDLIRADRRCHEIMYEAANHPYLYETLVMLYAQSHRLWHRYLPEIGDMHHPIREHIDILHALRNGDPDGAAELVETHILKFQAAIQQAMMQELAL